ncbi:MAG: glycosyltransferase, partial [Chloroflexota bacterium]|nr:glycosyltransferase [Chloroflexota bacterium]
MCRRISHFQRGTSVRILRVHNRYVQPGGEDVSLQREVDVLRRREHCVEVLEFSNESISRRPSLSSAAGLALTTVWSERARVNIRATVSAFQPDLVHFDNTFPLVSPAAYGACKQEGVAVVQTLHNYRLLCPSATFYRDGRTCEDCLGKTPPLPGVVHACYHGSHAQTAVVAAMLTTHRLRRTWSNDVDRYIALTEFAKGKFVEGGLPEHLLVVKPNFVSEPQISESLKYDEFLFVGRLVPEKGVSTLIAAAHKFPTDLSLHIAGDGPLMQFVQEAGAAVSNLVCLGRLDSDAVAAKMSSSVALIFPSEWYEGFPMTIVEAYSRGLPVIASNLGSMA